eukprot:INCI449.2.p1 GENE.INCI449.2~~INCI449.2.p1  ORF type:complete len:3169 (+),score=588.56 INCI449.2:893-9508(+)
MANTGATVAGGHWNSASGFGSFVGGGGALPVSDNDSTLGNKASGFVAAVVGGMANHAAGNYSFIGGGFRNTATAFGAVIGGGGGDLAGGPGGHRALGRFSSVLGGEGNLVDSDYAFAGGGYANRALLDFSVVAGGNVNTVGGTHGVVAGGFYNRAIGNFSAIGGGQRNQATGPYSSVGGGDTNAAVLSYSTVAGGQSNTADGHAAIVSGGFQNEAGDSGAAVGGGFYNTAGGLYAVVAGGASNMAVGYKATISGGQSNSAAEEAGTVAGGQFNTALARGSTISGGQRNFVDSGATRAVVAGGQHNHAQDLFSVVSGGSENTADGQGASISGGVGSFALAPYSTVGGGAKNNVTEWYATIAGGFTNVVSSFFGTVGGGRLNTASSNSAVIGGGRSNVARSSETTVAGGFGNTASNLQAAVAGGLSNTAAGERAFVGGGSLNVATGTGSTISGGSLHLANGGYGTICGGTENLASGAESVVTGGGRNQAAGDGAVVSGGASGVANGNFSVVSGGTANTALAGYSVVGGGAYNSALDTSAVVGGGLRNAALASASTIVGGAWNTASGFASFVGGGGRSVLEFNELGTNAGGAGTNRARGSWGCVVGGFGNTASGNFSTVSGGANNLASGVASVVAGGGSLDNGNEAAGTGSAVLGGDSNFVESKFSFIGGGSSNEILGSSDPSAYAAIAGGVGNVVSEALAGTIGGGAGNFVNGVYAVVSGGSLNEGTGPYATVSGGHRNYINTRYAGIASGSKNRATGEGGFIGGGQKNSVAGVFAVVAGGEHNTAVGDHVFIGGGASNTASGSRSVVLGHHGRTQHNASAVLAFREGQDVCMSVGKGSVNICTDAGLFVDGDRVITSTDNTATLLQIFLLNASLMEFADNLATLDDDFESHLQAFAESETERDANASLQWRRIRTLVSDVNEQKTAVSNHSLRLSGLETATSDLAESLGNEIESFAINNTALRLEVVSLLHKSQLINVSVVNNANMIRDIDGSVGALNENMLELDATIATQAQALEDLEVTFGANASLQLQKIVSLQGDLNGHTALLENHSARVQDLEDASLANTVVGIKLDSTVRSLAANTTILTAVLAALQSDSEHLNSSVLTNVGRISGLGDTVQLLGTNISQLQSSLSSYSQTIDNLETEFDLNASSQWWRIHTLASHIDDQADILDNHSSRLSDAELTVNEHAAQIAHLGEHTAALVLNSSEMFGAVALLQATSARFNKSLGDVGDSLDGFGALARELRVNDTVLQGQIDDLAYIVDNSTSKGTISARQQVIDRLVSLENITASLQTSLDEADETIDTIESLTKGLVTNSTKLRVDVARSNVDLRSQISILNTSLFGEHDILKANLDTLAATANGTLESLNELTQVTGERLNFLASNDSQIANDINNVRRRVSTLEESSAILPMVVSAMNSIRANFSDFVEDVTALDVNVSDLQTSMGRTSEALGTLETVDSLLWGNMSALFDLASHFSDADASHSALVVELAATTNILSENLTSVVRGSAWMLANASRQQDQIDYLKETIKTVETGLRSEILNCTATNEVQAAEIDALQADMGSLKMNASAQSIIIADQQDTIAQLGADVSVLQELVYQLAANLSATNAVLQSLIHPTTFAVSTTAEPCGDEDGSLTTGTLCSNSLSVVSTVGHAVTPTPHAAPILHSIDLEYRGRTVLWNRFFVSVDAEAQFGERLEYSFTLFPVESGGDFVVGGTANATDFASPITRDFYLGVHVAAVLSNGARKTTSCAMPGTASTSDTLVQCPLVASEAGGAFTRNVDDVIEAIVNETGTIGYLVGIDVVGNGTNSSDAMQDLFDAFLGDISSGGSGIDDTTDQDVLVLGAFQDIADDSDDSGLSDGILDAISAVGDNMENTNVSVSSGTVGVFLDIIDDYVAGDIAGGADEGELVDTISILDDAIDSVCAAGPSNGAGTATTYSEDAFSVSCSDATSDDGTPTVVETTGGSVLVSNGNNGAVVAITSWNLTFGNNSDFLGGVTGVSVIGGDSGGSDTNEVGGGYQISVGVQSSGDDALRKSISCRYYSQTNGTWIERGVYLRGVAWDGNIALAICVSTHLTLFTVQDKSDVELAVERKITTLTTRLDQLGDVDLLDDSTDINYLVPVIFSAVTIVFVAVVVIAKMRGRASAVDAARKLYIQDGKLNRASVVRSLEFEAIIRGWLPKRQVLGLVALDILTGNTFLTLLFRWSHEHVVYTQADKAFMLYAAFLSTFLVQAFLADLDPSAQSVSVASNASGSIENASTGGNFGTLLLNVLIGALFANVFLFPVKYLLPFMISNVNSFTTCTDLPKSLFRRQVERLKLRCARNNGGKPKSIKISKKIAAVSPRTSSSASGKQLTRSQTQKQSANDVREKLAKMLSMWTTSEGSGVGQKQKNSVVPHDPAPLRIRRGLRFFRCHVPLPKTTAFRRQFQEGSTALAKAEVGRSSSKPRSTARSRVSAVLGRVGTSLRLDAIIRRISSRSSSPKSGPAAAAAGVADATAASDLLVARVVTKFQHRIRRHQFRRRLLRDIEFNAWRHDCHSWRVQLSMITSSFILTLGAFTLIVCLLLSAAFTIEECVVWATAVAQSLLMQLFVTDPVFTLFVLSIKLLVQWALLCSDRRKVIPRAVGPKARTPRKSNVSGRVGTSVPVGAAVPQQRSVQSENAPTALEISPHHDHNQHTDRPALTPATSTDKAATDATTTDPKRAGHFGKARETKGSGSAEAKSSRSRRRRKRGSTEGKSRVLDAHARRSLFSRVDEEKAELEKRLRHKEAESKEIRQRELEWARNTKQEQERRRAKKRERRKTKEEMENNRGKQKDEEATRRRKEEESETAKIQANIPSLSDVAEIVVKSSKDPKVGKGSGLKRSAKKIIARNKVCF